MTGTARASWNRCRRAGPCGMCAVLLAAWLTPAAGAQQIPGVPDEILWVGLFSGDLARSLENENRLKELCTAREGSEAWHDCRAASLEPRVLVIPVRSEPREDARRIGEIVILALPGRGLQAFASSGAGEPATRFTPDLFDPDWGYGPPWFHQTVLARRGGWFRVPVPSLGPGWIDSGWWSRGGGIGDVTETVTPGDIVVTPLGDMVVLGVERRQLRLRPEQPADMWCQGGDPPPLVAWQEIRIPFAGLVDQHGRLRLRPKYTRGC